MDDNLEAEMTELHIADYERMKALERELEAAYGTYATAWKAGCDHAERQRQEELVQLRAENERLTAALEYYADEDNWIGGSIYLPSEQIAPRVTRTPFDRGKTAREALAAGDGR